MAAGELFISGIGISRNVVATIVSRAVERVEGVASVGDKDIASSLVSVFTKNSNGYPFTKLAEDVRASVAEAIRGQVGYEVGNIDVCIDSLVFPKE